MELLELLTKHADKFADIPEAGKLVDSITGKLKDLGYSVIADATKEPTFIPKARLDEVIGERESYKGQAAELNKQLADLKKAASGHEDLTKQIEALQAKIEEGGKEREKLAVSAAIKLAALQAKANDPADIERFVDVSSLKLNADGSVTGVTEALKSLQESKAYLFGGQQQESRGGGDIKNKGGDGGLTREKILAMSPQERATNMPAIKAFYDSQQT